MGDECKALLARGYAQESDIPFEMGIIRNHYAGRTFIQPTQGARELGVRRKLSPNRAVLAGTVAAGGCGWLEVNAS